jgi:leucyl aminopeptidase
LKYTDLSWVETGCGNFCGSDHQAAIKAGFPAIFVFESEFKLSDDHIHTPYDLTEFLDYDHMIDHARMTLAFVYELAVATL